MAARLATWFFLLASIAPVALAQPAVQDAPWRSALYPEDWTPGYADAAGRFLHDFSYAGYHAGEAPIPTEPPGMRLDVTQPPYRADPTGETDATAAIQAAIDAAGTAGGGVVYLPPGIYRIAPRGADRWALWINRPGVVLRGAGPEATRLFLATYQVRSKATIRVSPRGPDTWFQTIAGTARLLRTDLVGPTTQIPLDGPPGFNVGDWVVITHDTTEAWNHDHHMDCASFPPPCWQPHAVSPATFYRRVVAVDREANAIILDAPTRYFLRTRDNARVYRVAPHLQEVGIENLSIGEQEHPGECATGDQYADPAYPCNYETHLHDTVFFKHVVNGWVRNVRSHAPPYNPRGYHLLSDGIFLWMSRHVTVEDTDLRRPQNRGGGGNGYPYGVNGNDNLIQRAAAHEGRHNFSFATALANGNVIRDSYAFKGSLNSDFHRHLSIANLVENVTLDQEIFEAAWRGSAGTIPHAHAGTQNVFWNMHGLTPRSGRAYSVLSNQFSWGLVIGTRGGVAGVSLPVTVGRTEPQDFLEGEGRGGSLVPQSLYLDQLARRVSQSPTPPAVGGRGFTLSSAGAGRVDFTWAPGTPQTAYMLLRFTPNSLAAVATLPALVTSATDTLAAPDPFGCYVLLALRGSGAIASSDLLCAFSRLAAGAAPGNLSIQLNQGTKATLSWTPPGGQTGFILAALGTPRSQVLGAAATSGTDETAGAPTCYLIGAVVGTRVSGTSDVVCGVPGLSTGLSGGAP